MSLKARIESQLVDLDTAELAEKRRHQETLDQIAKKRVALKRALALATPEADEALQALQNLGVIGQV